MNIKIKQIFVVLILIISITACTYMDKKNEYNIFFSPKLHSKYNFIATHSRSSSQKVGDKIMGSSMASETFVFECEISGRSAGKIEVSISIDSIQMKHDLIENDDLECLREYDKKLNEVFHGLRFKLMIDTGKLISCTGYEQYKEKLDSVFRNDLSCRDKLLLSREIPYSLNYFENIFFTELFILPTNSIAIGAPWSIDVIDSSINPIHKKVYYSVDTINPKKAVGKLFANVRHRLMAPNGKSMDMIGELNGRFAVESDSGMLLSKESILKFRGDVSITKELVMQMDIKDEYQITGRHL